MIRLDLPVFTEALKELELGLNGKTKKYALTIGEKAQILEIYQHYELSKGFTKPFLKAQHLDEIFRKSIRDCYQQVAAGKRLESLRARILLDKLDCPCCGLVQADTIDHYLPQDDYPALAIYSSNLIPYCFKCNNKKRSVDGTNPAERFVHVYYDPIPDDIQFLMAKAEMVSGALIVNFELNTMAGLDPGLYENLNFQLRRVDFYQRASRLVNDLLSPVASYMHGDFLWDKSAGVKFGLERNYKQQLKFLGKNNWKTVLFQALMNCEDFCNGGFITALNVQI